MKDFIEPIVIVIFLILFSILGRVILEKAGQKWITTFAHTTTLILLPVITFMITKVISGNIALSLGMVGALSIVRFRNPVRSPLELSVYFAAITMGIAASVHIRWLFYFVIAMLLAAWSIKIATKVAKKYKKDFYKVSFSEGNPLATLEILTNEDINLLDQNKLLISKNKNENDISYILASTEFQELQKLLEEVKVQNNIIGYNIKTP
tara:strand:- start:3267 stop:3890 length:624 start_codon:yes stop_codon:yes gene_type:complete